MPNAVSYPQDAVLRQRCSLTVWFTAARQTRWGHARLPAASTGPLCGCSHLTCGPDPVDLGFSDLHKFVRRLSQVSQACEFLEVLAGDAVRRMDLRHKVGRDRHRKN